MKAPHTYTNEHFHSLHLTHAHTHIMTHAYKYTHSTPLFFPFIASPNLTPSHQCAAACSVKSLSIPKLLVKRTKLENKTVQLTDKITCCLHLAVAIKALMTSEDGLLMWCLKAFSQLCTPHAVVAACHSSALCAVRRILSREYLLYVTLRYVWGNRCRQTSDYSGYVQKIVKEEHRKNLRTK